MLVKETWVHKPEKLEVVEVSLANVAEVAEWLGTEVYSIAHAAEGVHFVFRLAQYNEIVVAPGGYIYKAENGYVESATPENLKKKYKKKKQ